MLVSVSLFSHGSICLHGGVEQRYPFTSPRARDFVTDCKQQAKLPFVNATYHMSHTHIHTHTHAHYMYI